MNEEAERRFPRSLTSSLSEETIFQTALHFIRHSCCRAPTLGTDKVSAVQWFDGAIQGPDDRIEQGEQNARVLPTIGAAELRQNLLSTCHSTESRPTKNRAHLFDPAQGDGTAGRIAEL